MGASNKDEMQEIVETLKEARQNALLGNYERAIVYFKGIMHDMGQLIHTYDEKKTRVSKQDLQKYRAKFETELRQVEEMNNTIASFRNLVAQPVATPPSHMPNNFISAYNMPGGNHGHGLYDPFETPERDPDVWPPPPPLQNKNRISNNYNPNMGFQVPNYSPKHKDYRGKQVMGNNNDPKSANNARPQLNKGI